MKNSIKYLAMMLFSALFLSGCYTDKEDVLYRFTQSGSTICDTTSVTYSQTIAPIMQSYCNVCHSAASPSGGWTTENYSGLQVIALNGKLYGVVSQATGFSAMPKGGNKISDCDIAKIKRWIDSGTLNN
ncbi:MAG: cytochrome c [Bacteroidota bacterium]